MNFHKKKEIKIKSIESHIYTRTGKDNYSRFEVCYHNKYITTRRTFKTLEEARQFKFVCDDLINKQRLIDTNFKDKDIKSFAEYPETLLRDLGINPEDHLNFYSYIVPSFDVNFDNATRFLTDREKHYLIKYYKHGLTLHECGKEEGLTRERVRQIIAKGLEKIQHPSCIKYLVEETNKFYLISEEERQSIVQEYKDKILKELEEEKAHMTYEMALEVIRKHDEKPILPFFEREVDELKLSARPIRCLKSVGINTIGELCSHTRSELKSIKGMGTRSLAEIKRRLKKYDLDFKKKEK